MVIFVSANGNLHADSDAQTRLANSLCEAAENDKTVVIRKKLRQFELKLRDLYNFLICGDQGSMLRVAIRHNSTDVAKFIVKKVKKKNLLEPEKVDGKNVIQWAEELVASDPSKQSFLDLLKSKG